MTEVSGRRIIASILLVSSLFVGSAMTAAPASALTANEVRAELHMQHLINMARRSYHLRGLRYSKALGRLALQHSLAMARAGSIFHTSNLAYALRGIKWRIAGENVGMGPDMDTLHYAFMHSPEHRANNLNRRFRSFAIGVTYSNGIAFITVEFAG